MFDWFLEICISIGLGEFPQLHSVVFYIKIKPNFKAIFWCMVRGIYLLNIQQYFSTFQTNVTVAILPLRQIHLCKNCRVAQIVHLVLWGILLGIFYLVFFTWYYLVFYLVLLGIGVFYLGYFTCILLVLWGILLLCHFIVVS